MIRVCVCVCGWGGGGGACELCDVIVILCTSSGTGIGNYKIASS